MFRAVISLVFFIFMVTSCASISNRPDTHLSQQKLATGLYAFYHWFYITNERDHPEYKTFDYEEFGRILHSRFQPDDLVVIVLKPTSGRHQKVDKREVVAWLHKFPHLHIVVQDSYPDDGSHPLVILYDNRKGS